MSQRSSPKPEIQSTASHHAGSIVLKGALQLAALETCIAQLMRRHEALRTRLLTKLPKLDTEAGSSARVHKRMPVPEIFHVDLGPAVYACGRADAVRGFVECQVEQGFDLQRGPLWSCAVARLDAATSCLVLCAHPSIADVAVLALWLQELEGAYRSSCAGEPEAPETTPRFT